MKEERPPPHTNYLITKGATHMELNKYQLLLDLAETQNITRTAERLGYSQPGASHILKGIEKELGFPVVFREKYGVTLTPAAELLLPRIREIMAANEKLEQTIYSIKGLEYGKVTIGAYSSIAIHLLPKLLLEFKEAHPGIEIDIREGGADNILEWMDNNMIDFAFFSRPYARTMEFFPFGEDPLVAVLPKDYPTEGYGVFDMEKFENQPFIISAAGNDIDIHNALECSGITPNFHYSVLDDHTILAMVEGHLGVSILTELIVTGTEKKVKILPINPAYYRLLGIGMRHYSDLSPAAKTFVDFSKAHMGQIFDEVLNC